MSSRRIAATMLAILLMQVAVPLVPADATSGRSSPDFYISVMTLSSGGSVDESGSVTLAPGEHVLRIVVNNGGMASASGTLNLYHQASPSSLETLVTSVSFNDIAPSSASNPILITWNATSGDDQALFARVASSQDSDLSNNERQMNFDVAVYHRGTVLGDTVPGPTGGFTDLRLNHSIHSFEATVRNDGVMPLSSVFEVNFTDVNNPSNKVSFWSQTLTLQPGSLLYPPSGAALSTSFDASTMLGSWTMATKVHFNGTSWTNTIVSSVETVTFSDFIIDLSAPGDRAIEPGDTTTLTWIVTNLGDADNLQIELGSDQQWHDNSKHGDIISIAQGGVETVNIDVVIPSSAAKSTLENVYLNLTSQSTSPYTARSVAHIIVGDQYKAEVTAEQGPLEVIPAQRRTVEFTVNNSGNTPAAYDIDAGLSSVAENWIVELVNTHTGVLQVGENTTIYVQITPAPISSPINPSEKNSAGDTVGVWLSATPTNGGMPAYDSTQLLVKGVIAVDPGPEVDQIILTENDVLQSNGSGGVDEILSLSVEVRHNLGSGVTGGVDANLSVGTPTFTPASNTGGNNEAARWLTSVTPNSVNGLEIGEIFQSWLAIDGPSDELPMAGELTIPVTATPVLSQGQQSNIEASPVTRNISVIIPSVIDGEIITQGPLDADVGNMTAIPIKLANTGNDLASYRLTIQDDLPDLWTASLNSSSANSPSIVSNLSPSMADHPLTGNQHIADLTLNVKTDPQAPADTLQPLTIRVEDRITGELLSLNTLLIRVEESIDFELHPTNHTIDLSPYESPLTRVFINNTGNVATTFNIWLDESAENDVDFSIESATEVIIGAGFTDSVKIRLNPNDDASADEVHMITLWVEAENGVNKSASIVANISADHHLEIDVTNTDPDNTVPVTPGANKLLDVEFTNRGNLIEYLNVTAEIEGDWASSWEQDQIVLPINNTAENDLTITVPALGGNFSLANGDIINVTISLYSTENGQFLKAKTVKLKVAPVFLVEVQNWPDEMLYHRGDTRSWSVQITNVGNKDVTVSLDHEVLKPGVDVNSLDWEVVTMLPNLFLPVGETTQLEFEVEMKEYNPDHFLQATLRLTLDPISTDVNGTSVLETALKMSRMFATQDYTIEIPPENNSDVVEQIIWSHIDGTDDEISYGIELCSAERRIDSSSPVSNIPLEEIPWAFSLELPGDTQQLNLENDCTSNSRTIILLPPVEAWNKNYLNITINPPNRPNVIPNDGYDLTFRLYHPAENNGFTEYTEATFSFYFATKSALEITKFEFSEPTLIEGETVTLDVAIKNQGTAVAFGVTSTLVCKGIDVPNSVETYDMIFAGQVKTQSFEVETQRLDWWSQDNEVSCNLEVSGLDWEGSITSSDSEVIETKVESWSPGIAVSFVALLALLGASIGLLRLVGQNDKFRLAATYTGVLALGFAFHLTDLVSSEWGGFAILLLAAGWVWSMTWKSTVEFQLIHEDYQRARKGISTLYSDHFEALSDSKRQLSIILAMPILGMMGVVLGFPPQMNPNSGNMISLVGYVAVVIFGVIVLIWNANRLYGSLYGRLTEVEIQASRIERDLGDPARLLTELASDGLDITSIINQPKPSTNVVGSATHAEIEDWDETVETLTAEDDFGPEEAPQELTISDMNQSESEGDNSSDTSIDIEDLFDEAGGE